MMGSSVVPHIYDLRRGPNQAVADLKLCAPAEDPVEIAARRAVVPYVEALIEDFHNLSRDGKNIPTYEEGKRCQAHGFRPE